MISDIEGESFDFPGQPEGQIRRSHETVFSFKHFQEYQLLLGVNTDTRVENTGKIELQER